MGKGEVNMGPPTVHRVVIAGVTHLRMEASQGCEDTFGHVAMGVGERLTEAQWYACLQAAPQGYAALAAVLNATPAATWLQRVIAKTLPHAQWAEAQDLMVRRFKETWATLDNQAALKNPLLAA